MRPVRSRLRRRPRAPWIWRPRRRIAASSSRCSAAGRSSSVRSERRLAASAACRVGRQAALTLEQRLEQLGHRAQDVVGLRRDGLEELLVDAELAQVVDELGERRRREVDRQLLRAGLRGDAARVERPRALHAQLVGHAREGVLEGVGVALQDEVLAEDREAQPLGLAVDVVRRSQLVLGQEAAQVDGLRVLVGVACGPARGGRPRGPRPAAAPSVRCRSRGRAGARPRPAAARAAARRRGRRAGRRSRRPRRT